MDRRFKFARVSLVLFTLGAIEIINTGFSSGVGFIALCLILGIVSMAGAVVTTI